MPKRIVPLSDPKIKKSKPQQKPVTLFDGGGLFRDADGRQALALQVSLRK